MGSHSNPRRAAPATTDRAEVRELRQLTDRERKGGLIRALDKTPMHQTPKGILRSLACLAGWGMQHESPANPPDRWINKNDSRMRYNLNK